MTKTIRSYYPPGINMYVPNAQYSSDLNLDGINWFSLGTPALGAAGDIFALAAINAQAAIGVETVLAANWIADSPYGRLIIVTPSADTGAAGTVDIHGYDYLGQYMIERFAVGGSAGAAISGKKAFYRVTKAVSVIVATNAVTYSVRKNASKVGLPFKGIVTDARENNVYVASPAINVNAVDLTDPATAITGDPRGIYTGITAFNGVIKFEIGFKPDNSTNAAGNGGLFGIRHFAG